LALANLVQTQLVTLFGRTGSRNRGVKVFSSDDRGYRQVVAGRVPAVLPEPFFGSSASDAAVMAAIGKASLAEVDMKALRAWA
jgi:hypothetical protein